MLKYRIQFFYNSSIFTWFNEFRNYSSTYAAGALFNLFGDFSSHAIVVCFN